MTATVRQAGSGWATSGVNLTLASAQNPLGLSVTAGNMLVVTANQETALNDITGITDSGGNTWVTDVANSADVQGLGRCVFRCQSVGTVPTWIKVSATTSSTIFYTFTEVAGANATPFESPAFSVVDGSTTYTHAPAFTAGASNDFAICLATSVGDPGTITPNNGFTEILTTRNGRAAFYIADLGASGSKTLGYSSTTANNVNHLIVVYKAAVSDPTVSTVTGNSVTEGTSLRFTVTLSGATNRTTNYTYGWGGTAVNATDYNNDLSAATFSTGASFVGGQIQFASGYSSCTIDVPTVDNALDQADRTLILTVGGTASTGGLILDDDAPPVVTFSDGVESFGVVTCTATLGAVSGKDVTFDVSTANGSKTAGTHYTAIVAQTVTIPAGSLTAAITVNTL